MSLDRKGHLGVLLGSMNKAFKNARRKGTFTVRDLFFLNCIYKTISLSCQMNMSEDQNRTISLFYFRMLNSSSHLCKQNLESEYYKTFENKPFLHVTCSDSLGTNKPTVSDFTLGDNGEVLNESTQGIFTNEYESEFE